MQFAVHGSGDLLFGDGFAFWYTKDKGMDGVCARMCVCVTSHMSQVLISFIFHCQVLSLGLGTTFLAWASSLTPIATTMALMT